MEARNPRRQPRQDSMGEAPPGQGPEEVGKGRWERNSEAMGTDRLQEEEPPG